MFVQVGLVAGAGQEVAVPQQAEQLAGPEAVLEHVWAAVEVCEPWRMDRHTLSQIKFELGFAFVFF